MNRVSILLAAVLSLALWACTTTGQQRASVSPPSDCARPATLATEARERCALDAIERACRSDPTSVASTMATVLGAHPGRVRKAMGRYLMSDLEHGDLCARGEDERLMVIAIATENRGGGKSEKAGDWLMRQLGGPSGFIDNEAIANALAKRKALVVDTQAKRAGLPATPAGWTNLTGYTQSPGRINHILFTDGTGNNLLAGADGGGIWRSADGGATWSVVNDFLGSLSIGNFAKSAANASIIYAAINPQGSHTFFPFGIIQSTDNGLTWSQIASTSPATNPDFQNVQRVAVSPASASTLLAATNGGAYYSTNSGTTWTKVGGISTVAYFAAFHPTDANRMAVAYTDGTVRYTTTGDILGGGAITVSPLAGLTGTNHYPKLAYAKSDVTRMYVELSDNTGATRIFMNTNSGAQANWTEVPNAPLNAFPAFTLNNSYYLSYTGSTPTASRSSRRGPRRFPTSPSALRSGSPWPAAGPTSTASSSIPATTARRTQPCSSWTTAASTASAPSTASTSSRSSRASRTASRSRRCTASPARAATRFSARRTSARRCIAPTCRAAILPTSGG
jgi:hypothetical protein